MEHWNGLILNPLRLSMRGQVWSGMRERQYIFSDAINQMETKEKQTG